METPIEIEMNQRKSSIAEMIYSASQVDIFNKQDIAKLFGAMSQPLEFYKYSGDNSLIIDFLDTEIVKDTNGLSDFLQLEYNGVPLKLVILYYLQ